MKDKSIDFKKNKVIIIFYYIKYIIIKRFNEIDKGFIENIHSISSERIFLIKKKIQSTLKDIGPSDYIIYTTGSDGRKENMQRMSPGELILIVNDINISKDLLDCLNQGLKTHNEKTTYNLSNHIEIQKSISDSLFYYPSIENIDTSRVFFPTRFLDNQIIFGEGEQTEKRQQSYIKGLNKIDKGYIRDRKRRTNLHRNISETGQNTWKQNIYQHFGDNIYYDKGTGIEAGIKLGPLRYLQYTLMQKIMESHGEEINTLFGKSTQEKINILRENSHLGIQSEEDEKFLIHAYYYFLHIHHMMQRKFVKEREQIVYNFKSDEERKEFYEILEKFNSLIRDKL